MKDQKSKETKGPKILFRASGTTKNKNVRNGILPSLSVMTFNGMLGGLRPTAFSATNLKLYCVTGWRSSTLIWSWSPSESNSLMRLFQPSLEKIEMKINNSF